MTRKETMELTEDKKQLIRVALEDEIVSRLKQHKEWTPYNEANHEAYLEMGGYFSKKEFEVMAGLKKRKSLYPQWPRVSKPHWVRGCLRGRL